MDHLMTVLQSEHVRKVVGPDVALTNDFETATAVLAIERSIVLEGQGRSEVDNNLVAWYWVSTKNVDIDGTGFEAEATPVLVDLLKNHAGSEVSQVLVNTGITSPRVDVTKIFGGGQMPRYGVIYKMVMKTPASARAVRKVQALFAERFEGQLDAGNSYILFAKETLIASVAGDHRVSGSGQSRALSRTRTDRRTPCMCPDSMISDASLCLPIWANPLMSAIMMPNRARS
jgi:hypothetical protein